MTGQNNTMIQEDELEVIYQDLCQKTEGTTLNPYDFYIEECRKTERTKVDSTGKKLPGVESHHIIPKFDEGSDDAENLVLLTVREHVIAHWLRWKVLGKQGDKLAYVFRIGKTEEAENLRREAVIKAREREKEEGKGRFNPDYQRALGKKGGPIGGSRNTEAQFLARQAVGLTKGREGGIKNQGEQLTEFLSNYSIWAYSQNAASTWGGS